MTMWHNPRVQATILTSRRRWVQGYQLLGLLESWQDDLTFSVLERFSGGQVTYEVVQWAQSSDGYFRVIPVRVNGRKPSHYAPLFGPNEAFLGISVFLQSLRPEEEQARTVYTDQIDALRAFQTKFEQALNRHVSEDDFPPFTGWSDDPD